MLKLKNLFIIFIIIFFISFVVLMYFSSRSDEQLNRESKQYIDSVLPDILEHFDPDVFINYAAPELLANVSKKRLTEIFKIYKKLGDFKKYLGSKGKAKKSIPLFKGKKWIYAKYNAKAEFTNGMAIIKITIVKENGKWYVYHLKIDSKAFNDVKKKTK